MTALIVIGAICAIVASWTFVLRRDAEEKQDLRTSGEWEQALRVRVPEPWQWLKEHIGWDERITVSEFERLAEASGFEKLQKQLSDI